MSSQVCTSESIQSSRYQIRARFSIFNSNFKIKDQFGHDKYTVRSKMLTLRTRLLLEDMNGM
jgi:uncharacterized protein YxjI